jgi:hypothetical protein
MLRRQQHRAPDRSADVDAVHPGIAREDDVDQVSEGPWLRHVAHRLIDGHAHATDKAGCARPSAGRSGADCRHLCHS